MDLYHFSTSAQDLSRVFPHIEVHVWTDDVIKDYL